MADGLPTGLGVGAGLSGFAQGFASTFETAQETKHREQAEKNKTARELLIKGALDPKSPADPNDPGILKVAGDLLGEQHVPMFQALLKKNADYVYNARMQEHQARTAPLAVGEERRIKTPTGEEIRKGPPQPKAEKPLSEIEAEAGARAKGAEPYKAKAAARVEERMARREKRAEARKERSDIRGERRQFRDVVRKAAIKLRTDPKSRTWGQALQDWLHGAEPNQRLSTALAGIPAEALPPELQTKQAEGATGTQRTSAASEADSFLQSLSQPAQ